MLPLPTLQGRTGEAEKSRSLHLQSQPRPETSFRGPALLVTHLLEPQREKPLADGVLVVVVAPAGVSLEQFPDPYRRPLPDRAALFQEVTYHVHFPAVFVRGVQNSRRSGKPLPLPSGGAFQKPVENAARLGPQFFLKPPVLPFLGYPRGKRYQLDPTPYPVIGSLNHRLVVRRHENLESRHKVEELPV